MALYFSAHTTACLTKQALRELMQNLMNGKEVKVRRCVSSQIGGRMLTEVEAPDLPTLEKFFQAQHFNCEWIMRIDLESPGTGGVSDKSGWEGRSQQFQDPRWGRQRPVPSPWTQPKRNSALEPL